MKFLILAILMSLSISGMAQTQGEQAEIANAPSSLTIFKPTIPKPIKQITKVCGNLYYSETNRDTLDTEQLFYTVALDCNLDKQVQSNETNVALFSASSVVQQQRGHLTRWRRTAAHQVADDYNKGVKVYSGRGVPYVCMEAEAAANPCEVSGQYVQPLRFTASKTRVDQFIQKIKN